MRLYKSMWIMINIAWIVSIGNYMHLDKDVAWCMIWKWFRLLPMITCVCIWWKSFLVIRSNPGNTWWMSPFINGIPTKYSSWMVTPFYLSYISRTLVQVASKELGARSVLTDSFPFLLFSSPRGLWYQSLEGY